MKRSKDEIVEEIKEVIEEIKFYISMDGGDLEYVDFEEDSKTVVIKLGGSCVGCHLVDQTYNQGVREILINEIEEVEEIRIIEE